MSGALGAIATLAFAATLVAFAAAPDWFANALTPPLWSVASVVAGVLIVAPVGLAWWLVLRSGGGKR
ncbi:MAG: hypothetical protein AAGA68_06760 [Pseudomonadota bacterium]